MNRRSFVGAGIGAVASTSLLAGCLGGSGDGNAEESEDGDGENVTDNSWIGTDLSLPGTAPDESIGRGGLARDGEDVAVPGVTVDELDHVSDWGGPVPLLPIDVAYPWYVSQEARFVDARSLAAYEGSHVAGAAASPAPEGLESDDPTEPWEQSTRIVTYCGCPHHLSSQRAASLLDAGYEAVFALHEGFGEWQAREYPMASANGALSFGTERTVTGVVDADHEGAWVWLRHEPTGQREPAEIAADGSFDVGFRFVEVDADSSLELETPAWTRTGTVAELTSRTVR